MKNVKGLLEKYEIINSTISETKKKIQTIIGNIVSITLPTQDIELKEDQVFINTSSPYMFEITLKKKKIEKEFSKIGLYLKK